MNDYFVAAVLTGLFAFGAVGLAWMAGVASPEPSVVEQRVLEAFDWIMKGSFGALIAFLTRMSRQRNIDNGGGQPG